jgi:hypothetical protein
LPNSPTIALGVKKLLAALFAIYPAIAAAWPSTVAPAAQTPHPAVVRVIASEANGASLGTGALVAVDDAHGLVVTNWHVVRDATGPITVVFPDGFRCGALLLKSDRDWDLAALAIQRPRADPLPLATLPPRLGESLSIAGYGPEGAYRAIAGRCVKYHTPGGNLPHEILEVDVEARRGDSGGPICNSRGEIAGILFGAAGNPWSGGYTMGSYCGRVRQFLAVAYLDFQRLPVGSSVISQSTARQPATSAAIASSSPPSKEGSIGFVVQPRQSLPESPMSPARAGAYSQSLGEKTGPVRASFAADGKTDGRGPSSSSPALPSPASPVAQLSPVTPASQSEVPLSLADQIKSVLAVIGIIAILFHGMRLVGSSAG